MKKLQALLKTSLLIALCGLAAHGQAQILQEESLFPAEKDLLGFSSQESSAALQSHPNAQYSVGSIKGRFDVNGMGAATYSIPIEMPDGGGISPQLSVCYNSQTPVYGLLGYGFDVAGISVITRAGCTPLNDGFAKGVTYTSSDNYCLDGKRLIMESGTPGQEGASYIVEGDPYTHVSVHGSCDDASAGTWFEVKTLDGSTYTYGKSANSRLTYTNGQGVPRIAAWSIEEAEDRYANYVTYAYMQQDGRLYPSAITYGTNRIKPRGITNRISFTYESAGGDIRYFTIEDQRGQTSKRIQSITSSTNGKTYRKYTFQYNDSSDKGYSKFTRLTGVTEENGQGDKYVPTTISWNYLPAPSLTHQSLDVMTDFSSYYEPVTSKSFLSVDLTGDGISDIVQLGYVKGKTGFRSGMYAYISTSKVDPSTGKISFEGGIMQRWFLCESINVSGVTSQLAGISTSDIDGDGINDLVVQCYENWVDDVAYIVYRWIYGKDVMAGRTSNVVHYRRELKSVRSDRPLTAIMDVNADGKTDICYIENNAFNGKYYGKIYSNISLEKPVTESELSFSLKSKPQKIFNADYNNDGLPDLLILHNGGYKIYFNNGGKNLKELFTESNSLEGTSLKNYAHIQQGDFDGDGLQDFVLYPGSGRLSLYRSVGNGSFAEMSTLTGTGITDQDTESDNDKFSLIAEDFDGDGRSDLMVCKGAYKHITGPKYKYEKTQVRWYYSTGSELKLACSYDKDREEDALQKYIFTGDFDGDGLVEVANYGSPLNSASAAFTEGTVNIYKLSTGDANLGRVRTISDGMGINTQICYEHLTCPSVYSKTDECDYPVNIYTVPLAAVSEISTYHGSLGRQNTKYHYENLKIHAKGRGVLGFSCITQDNITLDEQKTTAISKIHPVFWIPETVKSTHTAKGMTSSVTTSSPVWRVGNTYALAGVTKDVRDNDGNIVTTSISYDLDKGVVNGRFVGHNRCETQKGVTYKGFVKKGGTWLPTVAEKYQLHDDSDGEDYETVTRYTYDDMGNVLTEETLSGTELALTTTWTYDQYGNVLSSVMTGKDVKPVTTHNVYDASGRYVVKTYQDPAAAVSTYSYDIWGNLTSESDETDPSNILKTSYSYDGWGRLVSIRFPDKRYRKYQYSWGDGSSPQKQYHVLEAEIARSSEEAACTKPWVRTYYDDAGHETFQKSVGPQNIEISKSTSYNARGEVVGIVNTYGRLSTQEFYDYDGLGRLIRDSLSTGKVVSYSYESDEDGRQTVITNDNGRVTRKTTDSWGNITSISDAMGETVEYFYSSNGKPVMITSGDATVEMTYDIAGNQTSLMDPDAGTMTYAYAADGTLIRETDGRGIETVYAYDDLGRVVSAKTGDFVVFNVYGTSGPEKLQLVEQAAGENSVEFTHDIYGRVLTETRHIQGESPLEYSYEYNGQNLPSKVCYPGGLEVEYKYDRYGYTTQVKADGKEVYSLDSFDGLTTKSSFLGKLTLSTARDENWFENNVSILRDSTVLDALDESFDSLTGNLRSRARRGVSMEEFEYDDMDRLLTATKKNPNGLISNTSRVAYANNGNILSKSDLGEYEYDATFKPHAVVGISSAKPWLPTCTQTFAIHPIGRVQSISDDETHYHLDITYGPDLQRCKSVLTRRGGTVRKTVYGGAYENTVESGVSREFYYLDGNVIVVKTDGIFTPYLALTDNLGSYLAVVDSLGNKVFNAHYDAWGCQHDVTVNSIGLHRGYCGHEMLDEFRLINMNARLYSPYVGRFLAPDNYVQAPENTQSFNRYSYCLNNPLKYVDPDGNFWHIVIGAAVGGVLNLWGNWDNCDGFWQGFVAFCVGAGTGAAVAATGGAASAGLGSVIGVSALGGAGTAATNDIISQTGRNFSGFEDVNWKTTGKNALIGGVASSAGSAVGYWAASSSVVVNNINSPLLRSAVVSPLASGAGHVAGGTTYGLLEGNSLSTSFSQSFEGLGKDIAIGSAISLGTTMGGCFLHGVNPLNGEPIMVPNRGFSSVYGINEMTLEEGTVVDRYGYPTGEYVAPEGVPFEQRTLPRVKIKSPYYKYIVTKPIPGVQYGIAAPSFWLGAPGGGVQYQLPYSINDLIEAGYLQIIP